MKLPLAAIATALLVTGCVSVPDEREPNAYYSKKDQQEAELQKKKRAATEVDSSGNPPSSGTTSLADGVHLLVSRLSGYTPADYAKMLVSTLADERWFAINGLVTNYPSFARQGAYLRQYASMAVGTEAKADPDYVVRAVAVRALNRSRDASRTALYIRALNDNSDLVRMEAAKSLNNMPDADAIGLLARIVGDPTESMDVRVAAAEALRHYKSLEVARTLVSVLNDRDFGVAWQARRSLRRLTNADFRYDQAKWLAFLTSEKPFK